MSESDEILPTALHLDGPAHLLIEWSDSRQQRIAVKTLRDRCPCSVCRKQNEAPQQAVKANPLNILSAEEIAPLKIASMTPVGNYAYSIDFSDGHGTGIYSFEYLRSLE